jgi:hypothetical protein
MDPEKSTSRLLLHGAILLRGRLEHYLLIMGSGQSQVTRPKRLKSLMIYMMCLLLGLLGQQVVQRHRRRQHL